LASPTWADEARAKAGDNLASLPALTGREEDWRFTPPTDLGLGDAEPEAPGASTVPSAAGGPRAARLSLVSTTRVWTGTFAVSAFFSAVAGTLLVGFSGTGLFNIGDPYLFTSIASVVIGGTSLLGARGDSLRTVLGALILIQTTTILAGRDYDAPTQQVILGVLIVLFVATYAREAHVRTRI